MIRVLIADDQRLFGESLSTTLRNYAKDIDVVALAPNGAEAVSMVRSLKPDIVLMDVFMPVMDGVEATGRIKAENQRVKILMLSTYDEDRRVKDALTLGAAGYLLKDITPMELIASIRALSSGVVQISPKIVAKLMMGDTEVVRAAPQRQTDTDELSKTLARYEDLTAREREVLKLIAVGYDNSRIAEELCLAEHTVRNHVSAVYAKLGVDDRFQIIQLANRVNPDS
jgi:DNA-binding NarL/FixJ family response regulator